MDPGISRAMNLVERGSLVAGMDDLADMGSVKRGGGSLALVYEASAPASVEEVATHHRVGVIRAETRRNCGETRWWLYRH